jgi:hypothetical protein
MRPGIFFGAKTTFLQNAWPEFAAAQHFMA